MNTHIILAENIDGMLFGALVFFGTLGAAVVALFGVYPAFQGRRKTTCFFISPAVLTMLAATCYFGFGYVTDGLYDPEAALSDFVTPWLMFVVPCAITSTITISVLVWRRTRPGKCI